MTCSIVIRNRSEEEGGGGGGNRQTDGWMDRQMDKLSVNLKLNFGTNPELMHLVIIFDWLNTISGIASAGRGWVSKVEDFVQRLDVVW